MAAATTTATAYISQHKSFLTPRNCAKIFSNSITFGSNSKPRRFSIRNSSNDASAAAETTTVTEENSESSIEAPEETPSLISTLNAERALRGMVITDANHYGRLGIQRGCSNDQVREAYKKKVDEVMNKEGIEEEERNKTLELLKESFVILSSGDERRLYDWSLARNENRGRYVWPYEADITTVISPGTPPPQEPENVEPTRLVGYFILVWVVIGFTLSIVLNR